MKRIYVLHAYGVGYDLGVDYYAFYIVYPGIKHAYKCVMSMEGWFLLLKTLKQAFEIVELSKSDVEATIWDLISRYEAKEFQAQELKLEDRLKESISDNDIEAHKADFQSA